MLTDSNLRGGGEDFIIWVTIEPLFCIFETNVGLYTNNTSIEKKRKKEKILETQEGQF